MDDATSPAPLDPPVMSSCSAVSDDLRDLPQILPVPPSLTVSDLLTASRVAHVRYRELHDRTENSADGDMTAAILEARDARLAALALDPAQTDPAWRVDVFDGKPVAHADLLQFYERYLAAD